MKITEKWLHEQGACASGIKWFTDRFGSDAAEVEADDLLIRLNSEGCEDWASWLRKRLPDDAPVHIPLQHYVFSWDDLRGRVGVIVSGDYLETFQVAGNALPARLLIPLLRAVLGDAGIARAERLHQGRIKPWAVTCRTGMSGCKDFYLKILTNERFMSYRTAATLHVSMSGKIEAISMWLGDILPILAYGENVFSPPEAGEYTLESAYISNLDFQLAGTPSGFSGRRS